MISGISIGLNATKYVTITPASDNYVPTQNLLSASGVMRLVEGYNGPAIRVIRDSDAAELDIGFAANSDFLDTAALDTFRDGSTLRVNTVYDQSGNGLHKTQTSSSSMPLVPSENREDGIQPLGLFSDRLSEPSGLSANSRDFSDYHIYAPRSIEYNSYCAIGSVGTNWNSAGAFALLAQRQFRSLSNTAFEDYWNILPKSQKQILAVCARNDGKTIHIDNVTEDKSALASQTFTGGWIGYVGSIAYVSYGWWYGRVTYAKGHTNEEAQAIKDKLYAACNIQTDKPDMLIAMGNSIVQGAGASYGRGYIKRMENHLDAPMHISNFGIFGQTIASQYGSRTQYAGFYNDSTATNRTMILIPEPTNDLDATSSGSITGSGTSLFTNYFVPIAQEMNSMGYEAIIAPTIIARNWTGSATDISEKESERQIYNQLVRDNAVTYGYAVADFASIEGTINRPDGIHPDDTGHENMAIYLANLINNL